VARWLADRVRPSGQVLATNQEVQRFLELLTQPSFRYLVFVVVTAWGQRPAAAEAPLWRRISRPASSPLRSGTQPR
jgi:hypothetical protein